MSLQTFPCPNGEICYAEECAQARQCMHLDEATHRNESLAAGALPAPMHLSCPQCNALHVDEGEWATRPHKTHQCQSCKYEWRPFDYPTYGVSCS